MLIQKLGPHSRAYSNETKALLAADPHPHHVSKDSFMTKEFMELENARLWPRVWQIACREEQVSKSGDWVKYDISDQSILVVRTAKGELKSYFNTCLHRGSPLKTEAEGNSREMRCRYHGWRWNLDGTLKEVTDAEDFHADCISCDRLRLPECKVETWGGWVFINMDRDAGPLIDFLGLIPSAMEPYELETRRLVRHRSTILPANWKTVLHAFTDGYHVQGTHPQLLEYNDDTDWVYQTAGLHSWHYQPRGSNNRPSKRLGDFQSDRSEMLTATLAAREGLDTMSEEARRSLKEVADQVPEDMPRTQFVAEMLRRERPGDEEYLSRFHDGQFEGEENPNWCFFPNFTTVQNALNSFWLQFRPNGLDPESMIFDVWSLARPKPGDNLKPPPKSEFYPDYKTHEWGGVLLQDMDNVEKVQRGLHNHSFKHFICGYQDSKLKHHDRVLRAFIAG